MQYPVLSVRHVREAMERAQSEKRLLLIYTTASSPALQVRWVERLGDQVITVRIDSDVETMSELEITPSSTIVAFLDGREVDRLVGVQDPDAIVSWLNQLPGGAPAIETLRSRIAANPKDMDARMELAGALRATRLFHDATVEYLWLWEHMAEHQPDMIGVRNSFLVSEIQELVMLHPPARAAISRVRDGAAPVTYSDLSQFEDWLLLNESLGESDTVLAWFDTVYKVLPSNPGIDELVEQHVIPLLMAEDRWGDAGALYAKPIEHLTRAVELRTWAQEKGIGAREASVRVFRKTACEIARALSAAGRLAEAGAIVEAAERIDDSKELSSELADAIRRS
jgi:hypothetical protein